jgi:nucleoid DNA-binding protein
MNMAVKKVKAKRTSSKGKSTTAAKTTSKKMPSVKDPMTKSTMLQTIADMTSLAKKDVVAVLDSFTQVIESHVKSRGPGLFVMSGLMKISVVKKPARPARKGVNPFTGENIMIKAKPAYKAVKIKALKKLKEMVD